ncbi:hypothetical protein D3C73_1418570 [compost metagenome]
MVHDQLLLMAGAVLKAVPAGGHFYQPVYGILDGRDNLFKAQPGFGDFFFALQSDQLGFTIAEVDPAVPGSEGFETGRIGQAVQVPGRPGIFALVERSLSGGRGESPLVPES